VAEEVFSGVILPRFFVLLPNCRKKGAIFTQKTCFHVRIPVFRAGSLVGTRKFGGRVSGNLLAGCRSVAERAATFFLGAEVLPRARLSCGWQRKDCRARGKHFSGCARRAERAPISRHAAEALPSAREGFFVVTMDSQTPLLALETTPRSRSPSTPTIKRKEPALWQATHCPTK
jgi:hypothetical protein